jgi:hypothetical protein
MQILYHLSFSDLIPLFLFLTAKSDSPQRHRKALLQNAYSNSFAASQSVSGVWKKKF